MVTAWNEQYKKLTTSDEKGLIIVWTLHKVNSDSDNNNNNNNDILHSDTHEHTRTHTHILFSKSCIPKHNAIIRSLRFAIRVHQSVTKESPLIIHFNICEVNEIINSESNPQPNIHI